MWEGTLSPEFSDDVSPDKDDPVRLRHAIPGALFAIEQRGADPSDWNWARRLVLSSGAFDRWLKEVLRNHHLPARPKGPAGVKPTKIKEFVDVKYPNGKPLGVSYKDIAKEAEAMVGKILHPRTVARAFGRK